MFLASYVALSTLIVVESLLIYAVMQSVIQVQTAHDPAIKRTWPGSPPDEIPDFKAPYLSTDGEFTKTVLTGQRSVLIFMSASLAQGISDSAHRWILAGVRRKVGVTRSYLICAGSHGACRELERRFQEEQGTEQHLTVVWDENAGITNGFGITKTPSALVVDAAGCVVTTGEFQAPERSAKRTDEREF